jgi:hypothetical protein
VAECGEKFYREVEPVPADWPLFLPPPGAEAPDFAEVAHAMRVELECLMSIPREMFVGHVETEP